MAQTYKGSFSPLNAKKYKGDISNITYRSGWERDVMKFLDENSSVEQWNSEEFVIRYYYDVDKKYHRYYIDFWVKWASGQVTLIEVKPKKQVLPPKAKNPKSKRSINEAFTYIKNQNKWEAARKVAADNNCRFIIWTEEELTKMGILREPPGKGKIKPLKRMKPYRKKKKK
jgi:hypothetical protein